LAATEGAASSSGVKLER